MVRQLLRIGTLALMLLSLTAPAWAEQAIFTGSREVRLSDGAVFDGKPIAAGVYNLRWGTNGDLNRVQVQLSQGRRVVATTQRQPDGARHRLVVEETATERA